jgi:hypothetical protein
VLANPPARVTVVSARTRSSPPHRVTAAKAGGYSVPAIAAPTSTQPRKNHGNDGAAATTSIAGPASSAPPVITSRGPLASR